MVSNSVDEVIHKIKHVYDADISIQNEGNQFIDKRLTIKDLHDNGVTIELSFNSEGKASMLQLLGFKDANFNIAEEYTSNTILEAVFLLMQGDFSIKRSVFGRPSLLVKQFGIKFKATGGTRVDVGPYANSASKEESKYADL